MYNRQFLQLAALPVFAASAAAQTVQPRAERKLTIDQLIQIKHPSGQQWTPDGSHVWFTDDSAGVNNVWVAPANGSAPAKPLTTYADGQNGNGGFWSNDGQTFFFQRDGGLLAVLVRGGTPRTAWASAAHARGFSLSPDGTRVAFVTNSPGGANGGDLIVHTIASNTDQTLAHADSALGAPSWSRDGTDVIYTLGAHAAKPIPHYASPPEIGPKLIFVATEFARNGGGGTAYTIPATGGTAQRIAGRGRGGNGWIDATHTLSTRVSNGGLTRTTESVDANGGPPT
ncbi:MAG: LpqB family beta-propeller domain-containing protein, partial [Gemmatimonadaceae bacterium]